MNNKVIAGIIVVVIALALVPVAAKMMGKSGAASAPAGNSNTTGNAELAAVATEVATALTQGNFDAAAARFDAPMRSAMDAAKWNQAWAGVASKLGAFKQQTGARVTASQGYDIVFVGCEFERGKADLQLTFNASGQVSGLFIR